MGMVKTVGLVLHPGRDCDSAIVHHPEVGQPAQGDRARAGRRGRPDDRPGGRGPQEETGRALRPDGQPGRRRHDAARDAAVPGPTGAPVLGVNVGRLGFLAEIDLPELADALAAIDEQRFTVESRGPRCAPSFRTARTSRSTTSPWPASPASRLAAVEVTVEGHPFVRYAADADRGRHADRVDRVQLLRRRPDRLAHGRGPAGHPGRAALGVQPGRVPGRRRAGSRRPCCRPAASSPSRSDGIVVGHVQPGRRDRCSACVPDAARWSGSARPRSTSAPGASSRLTGTPEAY